MLPENPTMAQIAAAAEVMAISGIPDERMQGWADSMGGRHGSTLAFARKYRKFSAPIPWFHELWYEAYDDDTLSKVFVMGPRYHAKTTTILTYVIRRLCENHHLRVGILSQTDKLAKHFLAEVKFELESNEAIQRDYFQATNGEVKGEKWDAHEIVLADARFGPNAITGKDVSVFSVSRGSQITGYHCDLLIVDDLESKESTDSDTVREDTREWWAREVASVVVPEGKTIGTGTRKHFDDIYAYWLLPGSGWTIVDKVKSVYMADGRPIWPQVYSEAALVEQKRTMDKLDLLAWPQEFLNEPRPSETQMFFPDKWPKVFVGDIPRGMTLIQMWDLAISEKEQADYTVGVTIGVDDRNAIYPLDLRRGHWDFNRTLAEIADMGQRWSTREVEATYGTLAAVGIEQVAYQAAAVQEATRRTMLPIVPVEYKGRDKRDKTERARLLEARAAAKLVYHPVTKDEAGFDVDPEWWGDFAAEAIYFPNGAHDDQVDALSSAVKLAGAQADAISWQYGVWKCRTCGHMAMFEPHRPCPKCGTRYPAEMPNPELVAMGELGTVRSSAGDTA